MNGNKEKRNEKQRRSKGNYRMKKQKERETRAFKLSIFQFHFSFLGLLLEEWNRNQRIRSGKKKGNGELSGINSIMRKLHAAKSRKFR